MSEERFDRIEQRLDRLEAGQNELRADLKAHAGRLESGQQQLRSDLEGHVGRLDGLIDDLDQHMHVLHEDVIARIAAIPEYTGPTKAEMQQGFADLREAIERRLDPLEAIERRRRTRKPRH
jgi:chromosome segregation ATPase